MLGIIGVALLGVSRDAFAKKRHFEQVRVVLISRAAHCATCHMSNDKSDWDGAGLNIYGKRLHEISPGDPLADRILMLEHGPTSRDTGAERERRERDRDIDGDGVPNWVEILARSNPADAAVKPSEKRIERVRRVVSCKICHIDTNLPGKRGLAANPHNAFGKMLSETTGSKGGNGNATAAERHRAAERIPILKRIELTMRKRPKGSRATYWEKLRLMRLPADEADQPSPRALKSFRKWAAAQRSKKKRDPARGMIDPAHDNEGFLQDCKRLE